MIKTKVRAIPKGRRAVRRLEPSLPIYFKQIQTFLKDARVPLAQQPDLTKARIAVDKAIEFIYGPKPHIICLGENPLFPPFI